MMKNWMMIGAALLVFMSLEAAAQIRRKMPDPEENARVLTERMAYRLNLSDEQKKEVLAINLENAKKRALDREKQKAEMDARKADRMAQEEKIKAVLTEEQRKQWEEIKSERRPGERPGGMIEDQRNFHPRQHHRPGRGR